MAVGTVNSIEEVNKALQDLQDQVNLMKNQPQNLHGRSIQQSNNPLSMYVTQAQLNAALLQKVVPGTTVPIPVVTNILNKANFWRQLQTFLAGIVVKFISIFTSGVIPARGALDGAGHPQYTMAVSQDPGHPQYEGFWLMDNRGANYQQGTVMQINHEQLLAKNWCTFFQDYFIPFTDGLWDLGRANGTGSLAGAPFRWGGVYALTGRFEGTNSGSAIGNGSAQGVDIGYNFITAQLGAGSATLQPLTISATPLNLVCTTLTMNTLTGITQVAALAKLTLTGANGSITFTNGIATAYTAPT